MNVQQRHALLLRETDVRGALNRFCDNEALYVACLKAFLSDTTMEELNRNVNREAWDDAFTAAHALKGLAGNMGFVPLMHSTAQLIVVIRGGRTKEVREYMDMVNSSYRDICDGIRQGFVDTNDKCEGSTEE